jgi:hypothetical protein
MPQQDHFLADTSTGVHKDPPLARLQLDVSLDLDSPFDIGT